MLQFFHRYRIVVVVIAFTGVFLMVFTGFGFDYFSRGYRSTAAISVGEREFSFEDVARERRLLEEQYLRLFGEQAYSLLDAAGVNLQQQVTERLIDQAVLATLANDIGFVGGREQKQARILSQFQGAFSPEAYSSLLRNIGLTPQEFEARLGEELSIEQLSELLATSATPSEAELRSIVREKNRTLSVSLATFDPQKFSVPQPTEDQIRARYEERSRDYELPARAKYRFILISPAAVIDRVPTAEDDIELLYGEQERRFTERERVRLRQIRLSFPENASEEQRQKIRERASAAREKLIAGTPVATVVREFSDDTETKLKGGERGVLERKDLPAALRDPAFAFQGKGITEPIEHNGALFILIVEEYLPERIKPLSEVREDVVALLRKQEAPAFAADLAHDLFDAFQQTSGDLVAIASSAKLTVVDGKELLSKEQDPLGAPAGLSRRVLSSDDAKQLIELPEADAWAIVEVGERRKPELPSLDAVRSRIVTELERQARLEAARNAAQTFAEEVAAAPATFAAIAQRRKVPVERVDKVSSDNSPSPKLQDAETRAILARVSSAPSAVEIVTQDGTILALQVTAIEYPSEEEVQKKLVEDGSQLIDERGDLLRRSITARLRAQTEIHVDDSLYGGA